MIVAIAVYFFISVLINYLSQLMGSAEYAIQSGYTSMTDISKKTTFFVYAYNILLGPISILLLTTFFKLIGWDFLINHIYLLPFVYFAFRTILVGVILNRWKLINKFEFLSMHFISISLSFLLYFGYIRTHIDQLIIVPSDLISELWLITFIYIAGIMYSLLHRYYNFPKHVDSYIEGRFQSIMKEYGNELKSLNTEEQLILLSVMIYEDYQRPRSFRIVEKFLHRLGVASSTGIMQIEDSNKYYNDRESIIKMRDILVALPRNDRSLEYFVKYVYNQTDEYLYSVIDIYYELQSILSRREYLDNEISLVTNVVLIDTSGIKDKQNLAVITFPLNEDSTFIELFNYISIELKLQEKNISVWRLNEETEKAIYNARVGVISEDGTINWNYSLEDSKIIDSLKSIGIDPRHTEIEILCTEITETGDGSGLFIDELRFLIDNFKEILETALLIYETGKVIKAFINFVSESNNTNKERIVKTIKTRERWKFGFSSQEKYDGQEIVEESIMKYLQYEKDEERKEWVDRGRG